MINLREWALPLYTIMMQMAAGTMLTVWTVYTLTARQYGQDIADRLSKNMVMIIFITVVTSMVGSHYHLSRPFHSIYAITNLGSSWLSREILFTILFAISVGILWLSQFAGLGGLRLRLFSGWLTAGFGLITVYCMANVYMLPTQVAWNTPATPVTFFCTTILLGSLAVATLLLMHLYLADLTHQPELAAQTTLVERALGWCVRVAVLAAGVELAAIIWQITNLSAGGASAQASINLLLELYQVLFIIRMAFLIIGVSTFVLLVSRHRRNDRNLTTLMTPVYFTFLTVLVGEVLGRFLFYAVHVRSGI